MSGFIPGREAGAGRGEDEAPMGVEQKPHIITHLNGAIVDGKPHNCRSGGAVVARFESLHACFGVD